LDPNSRWNGTNYTWNLISGVYEIGTNITVSGTSGTSGSPGPYAVRIVNDTTGAVLAIANSVANLASNYEHTTHLSTIIKTTTDTPIRVDVDLPQATLTCTIHGVYTGYDPYDAETGANVLTDFWYHRVADA
jgi:hypothetical protein